MTKIKIRHCCSNCANFVKYTDVWDEHIEYWCDLSWDETHKPGYDRSELDCGLDKNKCKFFKLNLEKLKDAFACDEEED